MLTQTINRALSQQALRLRASGPTISFVIGVGGVIAGTYLACRATLRLEKTLDEIKEEVDVVKHRGETIDGRTYTEADNRSDLMVTYGRGAAKLVKLYGPAISVQAVSLGLLTGSHVVLKKRNTNLMLAYAALDAAFRKYRDQVEATFGDQIREIEDRKSNTDRLQELMDAEAAESLQAWSTDYSPYARFFDETSFSWEKNAEMNRIFVETTQAWAQNRLTSQGYLFLNDVYKALGMEASGAGQAVGWVLGEGNANVVDFGMFHPRNSRFLNLEENVLILDFNLDGIILDRISPTHRIRKQRPTLKYVERRDR